MLLPKQRWSDQGSDEQVTGQARFPLSVETKTAAANDQSCSPQPETDFELIKSQAPAGQIFSKDNA